MSSFDFAYPENFLGFHSGWNENKEPTKGLSLTFRKQVKLAEVPSFILKKVSGKVTEIPAFVKSPKGKIKGLSCGAGSALIRFNDKIYKLKRCGIKNEGFQKDSIKDRQFSFRNKEIIENTTFEHGGALDYTDALREFKNGIRLEKEGFILPQKIIGIRGIKLPFNTKEQYSCLIFEVESDLRIDEFCMAVITNMCSNYKKNIHFNAKESYFYVNNLPINKLIRENEDKFALIYAIGGEIGNIYRRLHNKGYIRGIGNSWYGNEVLMPDGKIGICDLDATYNIDDFSGLTNIFKKFQNNDYNLFITGAYSSLSYFENALFDFSAESLLGGFKAGYSGNRPKKIKKSEIIEEISAFMKNRWRGIYG